MFSHEWHIFCHGWKFFFFLQIQKETGGLLSLKDMYRNLCNETLPKNNTETISDIVLIVLFNFPNFSIIPLLEILLRPLFTRIVYCGFNPSDNETSKNMKTFRNSGIEIITYPEPEGTTPGGFSMGQNCPVLVMKRMKDVQVRICLNRFCCYCTGCKLGKFTHSYNQLSV